MVDRSGPTGVPRSPTRWQSPHRTACDQNSRSPRAGSPSRARIALGPGVRAELPPARLGLRQVAVEQVADRAVREPRGRGQHRVPLGRGRARRGRSAGPGPGPTSGRPATAGRPRAGPASGRSPVHPGDPAGDRGPGPPRRGPSEPMWGIRSRPNLAIRKYRVLAYGSPGLMIRASGRPKSPRVGRTSTAFISPGRAGNWSRSGTEPPPPSEWQWPQLAWR